MLKNIQTTIKLSIVVLVFVLAPVSTLAGTNNSSYYDVPYTSEWSDWTSPSTGYYSYDTPVYDYSYDYYPTQSYNNYSTPQYDYGNYDYGSGYTYPTTNYGSTGYSYPTYESSYTTTSAPSNTVVTANAVATASSNNTNTNTNINNNNVYVYTTPQGNAVVNNPLHQYLAVTCSPSTTNPRVGQTVTMTAYATGGT